MRWWGDGSYGPVPPGPGADLPRGTVPSMADLYDLRMIRQPASGLLAKLLIDFVLDHREDLDEELAPSVPIEALEVLYMIIGYLKLDTDGE